MYIIGHRNDCCKVIYIYIYIYINSIEEVCKIAIFFLTGNCRIILIFFSYYIEYLKQLLSKWRLQMKVFLTFFHVKPFFRVQISRNESGTLKQKHETALNKERYKELKKQDRIELYF